MTDPRADVELAVVVPIEVDALVINADVRHSTVFQRWLPNFHLVEFNLDPQPEAFTNIDDSFGADPANDGVHLHWHLPGALTRAGQDPVSGRLSPPLAPNRWLVARFTGAPPFHAQDAAAAWVIESDRLDPHEGKVPYLAGEGLTPGDSGIRPTRIGVAHVLADQAWTEPADRPEPFLTAFGPGLPDFCAYQPYQQNVFSFHDPLTGVGAGELHYAVTGWYADPAKADPLTTAADAIDVLRKHGWDLGLPEDALSARLTGTRPRTYCGGIVTRVRWDPDGNAPDSDMPDRDQVAVAIGTDAADAFSALVSDRSPDDLPVSHEQFTALQQGTVDRLDGDPDAPYVHEDHQHACGFARMPAGYSWTVENRQDVNEGAVPPPPPWLPALNDDQDAYERAEAKLAEARQDLYSLWWLSRLPSPPAEYTPERFQEGIAARTTVVQQCLKDRDAARDKVPWSADPSRWEDAVAAWLATRDTTQGHAAAGSAPPLQDGQHLVRVPRPPFHRAGDPVVVLAGAVPGRPLTVERLRCRFRDELSQPADVPAVPRGLAGVPEPVRGLVDELACLSGALPTGRGVAPAYGTTPWRQPWSPLYLLWELDFLPIPLAADTWRFDGDDYACTALPDPPRQPPAPAAGGGPFRPPGTVTLRGRGLITPHLLHNLREQIVKHVTEHSEPAEPGTGEAVRAMLGDIHHLAQELDPLSQSLTGVIDRLAQRLPPTGTRPPGAVGAVLEAQPDYAPYPGFLPEAFSGWPDSLFQHTPAGQLRFTRLMIVDAFGQAVDLVDDQNQRQFRPVRAASVTPEHAIDPAEAHRYVELRPRLAQPSRLRFDCADAGATTPGPVAGWLVANHVDRSLTVHLPDGSGLCELHVAATGPSGGRRVSVEPLPGSAITDTGALPATLTRDSPLLAGCLGALTTDVDRFLSFLNTLDVVLPDIARGPDFAAGRIPLTGRPLALVSAAVALDLEGPPIVDPSWQYVFDPAARDRQREAFLARTWPVRLGEAQRVGDGLVGYFHTGVWTTFHTVAAPADTRGFVQAIGTGEDLRPAMDSRPVSLALVMDPHLPVHAITGILPVSRLRLPAGTVHGALSRLRPSFRMGPLLTTARDDALLLATPRSPSGTWQWAETRWDAGRTVTSWEYRPLAAPDDTAAPGARPVARHGFLHLEPAASPGGPS